MKLLDQRLCRFAGTPKEIGLALGRTLGARLAQNIERYIEMLPGPICRCNAWPSGRSWRNAS
jgi:hypothetical protein